MRASINRMLKVARNPHVANNWSLGLSDIYNRLFKDWADRQEVDSKDIGKQFITHA